MMQQENGATSNLRRDFYPENVGILAMDVYFPSQYVDQTKLEHFDQVSPGKYTIGLGQYRMSFCLDNEDINSICLTALNNMMEKYGIRPDEIGRLDVGTETLIDKSKSVKTTLMTLFEKSGNTDIEGVDNVNACFGGTSALFNAINWIESSYWDGRYACVVMGDIALYAKGNARPTGGAGAIAILVGPNAPLVFERGLRSTHIVHTYDFYKPVMDSEYPLVDGRLSISCYLNALDKCYKLYKLKYKSMYEKNDLNNNCKNANNNKKNFNLNSADAFLFHSPYCKLVQKSFARLLWNDFLDSELSVDNETDFTQNKVECREAKSLENFKHLTNDETLTDKNLEKELVNISENLFKQKTAPSLLFAKEIGNMYTPSLYSCLISHLLSKSIDDLANTRICLFSYGSGSASAMFSLIVRQQENARFGLASIVKSLNAQKTRMLENRVEIEPALYDSYLRQREQTNKQVPRETKFSPQALYAGTWYLKSIDANYRRSYERASSTSNNRVFDSNFVKQILNEELSKVQ